MVNTFVTASTPEECASNLDNKRLGKQRVEAKQIIDILESSHLNESKGYSNHPIVAQWRGFTQALKVYYNAIFDEWEARGYKNDKLKRYEIVQDPALSHLVTKPNEVVVMFPKWFFNPIIHLTYKCDLYRKKPEYYGKIFNFTSDEKEYLNKGYIWTSRLNQQQLDTLFKADVKECISLCADMGLNVPPQYRFSVQLLTEWLRNPLINPVTGRVIKEGSSIYSNYSKAAKYHNLINKLE
jgi:hypothetical protein